MVQRKRVMGALVTATVFMSLVAGCGAKTTETTSATTAPQATKAAEAAKAGDGKVVVGFSQIGAESGWRGAETQSIQDTAKADPTIDLKFSDAQQKQENQIKAIRSFIAQKVDVIAMAPVVETGWEAVLKEAKDAKIPVILVDRGIDKKNEDLYTSFIGSDFIVEGQNAAKAMAEHLGDKGNIVELEGTVGASAATDRKKGFDDEIKKHPNIKIVKSQSGDFNRATGKQVMEAILKSPEGKDIQGVYAHNDDMALGAIQAIEEAGKKPGSDVKIVSIDGIKEAFEAVKAGKLNTVVECNPLLGPQLFQAAKDLKAGKQLPKWIKSNEDVFTGQKAIDALPNRKY
ncbi:ABC transporter substrate-binding protein [Paenibacillus chondroitinus]|uniref:ABC transporter substrate-binding protein n=1 Tax=Paenibacillus chondroitinus TaxID=59842 RepID=A0ABU6D795_9BACL|nr:MULTISPECIES: ABC transporter substrate-binding protein [Paenibacillus]MCY9658815.1 ABC transporter substrate-binding protein [Paenibacillus anseongense]MEB4792813.1 ABC transporter substrate-binding protein [Paenibacillus chondroitinus]